MWSTHQRCNSDVSGLSFLLWRCAPYWMNRVLNKTASLLSFLKEIFLLLRLIRSPFPFFVLFRKYSTITALEQRQQYKDDFCAEYDEYRALHDRIGAITEMFVQLGSKINTLSPGTQEYKVLERSFWLLYFHPTTAERRIYGTLTLLIVIISFSLWRTKFYKSIENIRR